MACLLSLVFAQGVFAWEAPIGPDGEPFTKKLVTITSNGDRLIEFVRENETFEQWTKLVGYRSQQMPAIGNDPKKAAAAMALLVEAANPKAHVRVITDEKSDEVVVDFLTWSANRDFLEFNVFRYAKSTDAQAIVSVQLAYRFKDRSTEEVEKFKSVREAWLKHALTLDMRSVEVTVAGFSPKADPDKLSIVLDGELFSKLALTPYAQGDKQLRLLRQSETFEQWEKMISAQRMSIGTDPKAVADRMAQFAMLLYGAAEASVFIDDKTSEAYVHYRARPVGDRYTEFHIYRISKSSDGKAVIALHLARRIPQKTLDPAEWATLGTSWLAQARSLDMKSLFAYLGE